MQTEAVMATVMISCSVVRVKVLGNRTEFQRVASLLQDTVDFDIDVNASVFETNIRGRIDGDGSESDQC